MREYYTSLSLLRAIQSMYKTLHSGKSSTVIHHIHCILDVMRTKRASDMNKAQTLRVISMLTDIALAANRGDIVHGKSVLWDLHGFLSDVAPSLDACFA
jgi:methyl coenzyme M reductase gamma subunit